jgi:hypothetical protein
MSRIERERREIGECQEREKKVNALADVKATGKKRRFRGLFKRGATQRQAEHQMADALHVTCSYP